MPSLRLATGTATPRLLLGEFSFVMARVIMMGNFREMGENRE
jgi:hypothetical protein